jgi:DNA-binding transcriptional regulator YhcF (GntR family)
MQLNEYRDKSLQKKIDILPDANSIWYNEIKDRGKGAYGISKAKNNKDRNNTWQANHRLIIEYIERALEGLHRLPTVKEISKELKISRVTVHNHLKDYKNNPAHELERGMMNLMAEKILLEALRRANDFGTTIKDLKDALACFKMMNPTPNHDIVINNIKIDISVFNNLLNNLPENKKNQFIEIFTKD